MSQLEAMFNFPPTKRVNKGLITSPSRCDSEANVSLCSNTNGTHVCACNKGYTQTGGGTKCVATKQDSREFFYSRQLGSRVACPAHAKSDGTIANITGCRCPGGYFAEWSIETNDTLAPSLSCTQCAAGTWSYPGATECTPCWPGSWSLPGASHPYMCLCNARTFFDYHDELSHGDGNGDGKVQQQCTVDVTTCDAELGVCNVTSKTVFGLECVNLGVASCSSVARATKDQPCTPCPKNADSDVGAISVFECKCREVAVILCAICHDLILCFLCRF
jgi:hypothetical protein